MSTRVSIPCRLHFTIKADGNVLSEDLELELPDGNIFGFPQEVTEIVSHIWVSGAWPWLQRVEAVEPEEEKP